MTRQIILDTETTGFKPEEGHRIIEIGAIELIDRQFTHNDRHIYINPERPIDEGAFKVHGISTEFLSDKPLFAYIAEDFFDYIKGSELIIHNAPFDLNFLNHEFKWLNKKYPKIHEICTIIDTLSMARQRHPGQRNSLDALCKRYAINNAHRELHGARLDALLLAEVFLRMTGKQHSLFDMRPEVNEIASLPLMDSSLISIEKYKDLSIILANEEEIKAHRAYLDRMKKNGACLWESDSE